MAAPEGYKALGKIGISYKGDYNLNTVYERLDAVYHNGSTYLAIKDAPDGAPRNDKINWIYLAKGYDGETVDVAESEIVFTESETRENIGSGEKVSTVFGKIKKFFTDLTAPAFAQMITTKEDLLATKVTGYVPDAKAVADGFADVNGKLSYKQDKDYTRLEFSFTGGISFDTDWNEGIIECIFGENPNVSFTIPITKRMFEYSGRSEIILPFGNYASASDYHGGVVALTKSTVVGKWWAWTGKDCATTSRIAIYYR